MFSFRGVQHVVIVAGVLGIQSGLDAVESGVGDGAGNKTLIDIGVVGTVQLKIFGGQGTLVFAQRIEDGGIDVQETGTVTPVI